MAERWLTYQQAGEALGMSAEAVRHRSRRQGWRTQPGNEGRTLVLLPDDVTVRPPVRTPVQAPVRPPVQTADNDNVANMLEAGAAALHERAARAEAQRNAAKAEAAAERERADKAEARTGQAEAEREAARAEAAAERARATQAEAEREAARVAAAAAEGRAEGLALALAEARRPFWRRWIG